MSKMLFSLALFVLTGVGILYFTTKNYTSFSSLLPMTSPTSPTAGWKIYENPLYGYRLTYPTTSYLQGATKQFNDPHVLDAQFLKESVNQKEAIIFLLDGRSSGEVQDALGIGRNGNADNAILTHYLVSDKHILQATFSDRNEAFQFDGLNIAAGKSLSLIANGARTLIIYSDADNPDEKQLITTILTSLAFTRSH